MWPEPVVPVEPAGDRVAALGAGAVDGSAQHHRTARSWNELRQLLAGVAVALLAIPNSAVAGSREAVAAKACCPQNRSPRSSVRRPPGVDHVDPACLSHFPLERQGFSTAETLPPREVLSRIRSDNENPRFAGIVFLSLRPLWDSNPRPPPYHGSSGVVSACTRGHSRARLSCKSALRRVSPVPADDRSRSG